MVDMHWRNTDAEKTIPELLFKLSPSCNNNWHSSAIPAFSAFDCWSLTDVVSKHSSPSLSANIINNISMNLNRCTNF